MTSSVFLSLGLLVILGSTLRFLFPAFDWEQFRVSLNTLVLYILLPALIFSSVYEAPIATGLWKIPAIMALSILTLLTASLLLINLIPVEKKTRGALILAAAFGNVTYLGLPVLQGLFPQAQAQMAEVAVLCEITKTPINLTLGSAIACYYGCGENVQWSRVGRQVLTLPPIWAAVIAFLANASQIPIPDFFLHTCHLLGGTVTALMILSLGMALKTFRIEKPWWTVPSLVLKLAAFPLVTLGWLKLFPLPATLAAATVLEAGMPCQLLTFVIADRFGLDVKTLAFVVCVATGLSFFTLPLLFGLLT